MKMTQLYHKLIHKSEIVDKDAVYLPEEHAAIYEGAV